MALYQCLLGLLFMAFKEVSADSELMVCLGDRVETLSKSGDVLGSLALGLSRGRADVLALDSFRNQLFLADSRPSNSTIFSLRFTHQTKDPLRPIVPKLDGSVAGIAYDVIEEAVFWTTRRPGNILRSALRNLNVSTQIQLIHNFQNQVPHGIAVDSCRRKLYWSNCNVTAPSIESSELDGSDRRILVETGLFLPLSITLSEGDGFLYWVDEGSGYSFTVERIRIDGTGREMLWKGSHQQPVSVGVVPGERVYWTDGLQQDVWSLELEHGSGVAPVLVKSYKDKDVLLSGLVTMKQDAMLDPVACANLIDLKEKVDAKTKVEESCPEGYCLHEGVCSGVLENSGVPSCACKPGYLGQRCQYEEALCSLYCLHQEPSTHSFLYQSCGCSLMQHAEVSEREKLMQLLSSWRLVSICLIVSCSVLLSCTIALAVRTRILSKRPKLRRRYTVNKGVNKRSGGGIVDDKESQDRTQCEIGDIENCCNMNICETPCYEPEFRTPRSKNTREIEHRSLISDMEVPEPTRPPL